MSTTLNSMQLHEAAQLLASGQWSQTALAVKYGEIGRAHV